VDFGILEVSSGCDSRKGGWSGSDMSRGWKGSDMTLGWGGSGCTIEELVDFVVREVWWGSGRFPGWWGSGNLGELWGFGNFAAASFPPDSWQRVELSFEESFGFWGLSGSCWRPFGSSGRPLEDFVGIGLGGLGEDSGISSAWTGAGAGSGS